MVPILGSIKIKKIKISILVQKIRVGFDLVLGNLEQYQWLIAS